MPKARPIPMAKLDARTIERFWRYVDRSAGPPGCWPWLRGLQSDGYGTFNFADSTWLAHRIAKVIDIGADVPVDMEIDHLCRVRRCVNPEHLEVVTLRENQVRGRGFVAENLSKERCVRGHDLTDPQNVRFTAKGWRACRACARERGREKRGPFIPKDECAHGHSLTDPRNVRLNAKGHRICRTCSREQVRQRRQRTDETFRLARQITGLSWKGYGQIHGYGLAKAEQIIAEAIASNV